MENLILLPADEARLRLEKVQKQLAGLCDAVIVTDNANTYYFTGRVFSGWAYIPAQGDPVWFVRRPVDLDGERVVYVRKPEEIAHGLRPTACRFPVA